MASCSGETFGGNWQEDEPGQPLQQPIDGAGPEAAETPESSHMQHADDAPTSIHEPTEMVDTDSESSSLSTNELGETPSTGAEFDTTAEEPTPEADTIQHHPDMVSQLNSLAVTMSAAKHEYLDIKGRFEEYMDAEKNMREAIGLWKRRLDELGAWLTSADAWMQASTASGEIGRVENLILRYFYERMLAYKKPGEDNEALRLKPDEVGR